MRFFENVHTVKKTALLFFVAFGFFHFITSLMLASGYFADVTSSLSRISFIPFVLSSLFYLYTVVKIALPAGKNTGWIDYTFATIGGIVLIALLLIEFLVADSTLYL